MMTTRILSRFLLLAAVAVGVGMATPASAQPRGKDRGPGGREPANVREIEAELKKIKELASDLESKLKHLRDGDRRPESRERGPEAKGPPRGPFPPKGPFGFGPKGAKGPPAPRTATAPSPRPVPSTREGERREAGRRPMPGPWGPWGQAERGRTGWGNPWQRFPAPPRTSAARPEARGNEDVSRRIDQIVRELEELKRSLARR